MGKSSVGGSSNNLEAQIKNEIENQTARAAQVINLTRDGYFGKPGETSGVRVHVSSSPSSDAEQFTENFRGQWPKTPIDTGWKATNGRVTITFRTTSRSLPGLPVVDIRWNRGVTPLTSLRSQRVHFLGGKN